MKKIFLIPILCLMNLHSPAMGPKAPSGLSLLLVPARPAMVQLGMDMAAQQHALLVAYAPDTSVEGRFLNIWDGERWVEIPENAYRNGAFVKNSVSRLLVVGEENELTASLIEDALSWCPEVLLLGTSDVTELINQMGRLYGFDKKDWDWIAKRYELQLEDLNQNRPQISWYDANKASDLPPSEKPWKKTSAEETAEPPEETSLRPLEIQEQIPEAVEEVSPVSEENAAPPQSVPEDISTDFSLEIE
ncbi:MAG: hypothetical protein ACO3NW_11100 [Kiritimatiellia bacterium]